jgi:hypothetical protein
VLDARTPEEFAARRLPGAQLITHALTFEVLDSWPKTVPIVIYSNRGQRSLDRARTSVPMAWQRAQHGRRLGSRGRTSWASWWAKRTLTLERRALTPSLHCSRR